MHNLELLLAKVPSFLYTPFIFVAWVLILWLAKRLLIYRLERWAAKTSYKWDDALVSAISFPLNFLIIASGLVILEDLLPMSTRVDHFAKMGLQGCIIIAVVMFLDKFIRGLTGVYPKGIFARNSSGLIRGVIRGFIIGIGVLVFLDQIGVSITPILASLGIGSLAVALALQDTLSNLFAGFYVSVDRPIGIGDFVRLETGGEGYVIDIGWRSTRIRTAQNNIIIISNAKLMGSVITNFHSEEQELAVPIEVGVHYDSDLPQVERITLEVARQILKSVPGGVAGFEPVVRFHTFADSSINLTATLRAKEFSDVNLLKHEFIKTLHQRYRKEGIVIPYPIRTIYTIPTQR